MQVTLQKTWQSNSNIHRSLHKISGHNEEKEIRQAETQCCIRPKFENKSCCSSCNKNSLLCYRAMSGILITLELFITILIKLGSFLIMIIIVIIHKINLELGAINLANDNNVIFDNDPTLF